MIDYCMSLFQKPAELSDEPDEDNDQSEPSVEGTYLLYMRDPPDSSSPDDSPTTKTDQDPPLDAPPTDII